MDYDIDFVGYEYQVNTDIQHRLKVFESQILKDIYVHVNDHSSKLLALKYINKTLKNLLLHDIVVSPKIDKEIMIMIIKILNKPVYNEQVNIKLKTLISD